ncbi:phage tail tube protein [Terasakiella pusilla]|uniref:phage tail tube protein n=1 Tax=Terasakiella pusilla TaxID=64973 RepID=UPI003AA9663E
MADAVTEKYEEMVLEVETDTPGTYARICGMKDVTINRAAQLDSDEVPDCDDESKPFSVEKEVRSVMVTVAANGTWAQQSHGQLTDWFYSGATKNIRVGNLKALAGETEYERGPAFLTALNGARTKGKRVTADLSIEFNGTPERTPKA